MGRPHLNHPRFAILAIKEGENCQHDLSPPLIIIGSVRAFCFRPTSPTTENRFVQPGI
jgi:hypothetical protein